MSSTPAHCTYTVLLASNLWPQPLMQDVMSVGREHRVAGLLMQSLQSTRHDYDVDMRFVLPALARNGDVDCLILIYDGLAGISCDSARHRLIQSLRTAVPSNKGKQFIVVVVTSMSPPSVCHDTHVAFVWASGVDDSISMSALRARVHGFIKRSVSELAAAEAATTLEHEAAVPTAPLS